MTGSKWKVQIGLMAWVVVGLLSGSVFGAEAVSQNTPKALPERIRGITLKLSYATPEVVNRAADYGVNFILFNMSAGKAVKPAPTAEDPFIPYQKQIDLLRDDLLPVCKKRGLKVALLFVPWGRNQDYFWQSEKAGHYYDHWVKFWEVFAEEFKDDQTLVAYDLMGEPNYKKEQGNVWQDILLPKGVEAVRKSDPRVWLIVEPGPWGMPSGFKTLKPVDDPYVMYGFHPYAPHGYLHQGVGPHKDTAAYARGQRYPGKLQMFPGSPRVMWNKAKLKQYMASAHQFALKHKVRMLAGEWGVVRWAPGGGQWTADMISIFEEWNFDWCSFSLNGWNGWNPTFGPDDRGSLEAYGGHEDRPVLKAWKAGWALNQDSNKAAVEPE